MTTQFSSKWGVVQDDLVTPKPAIAPESIAVFQFVGIVLVLALIRPSPVMVRTSRLAVPRLCIVRVVVLAALIVALTYFYPAIVSA